MTLILKEPANHQIPRVQKFLEQNIIGYQASGSRRAEDKLRAQVRDVLPKDASGSPYPSVWRASYSNERLIVGAGALQAPYETAIMMKTAHDYRAYAEGFLMSRRILEGLAVSKEMRREGLGSRLLEALENQARLEGPTI